MTQREARAILDAVRYGEADQVSMDSITDALIALGDLPQAFQLVAQSLQLPEETLE